MTDEQHTECEQCGASFQARTPHDLNYCSPGCKREALRERVHARRNADRRAATAKRRPKAKRTPKKPPAPKA